MGLGQETKSYPAGLKTKSDFSKKGRTGGNINMGKEERRREALFGCHPWYVLE